MHLAVLADLPALSLALSSPRPPRLSVGARQIMKSHRCMFSSQSHVIVASIRLDFSSIFPRTPADLLEKGEAQNWKIQSELQDS